MIWRDLEGFNVARVLDALNAGHAQYKYGMVWLLPQQRTAPPPILLILLNKNDGIRAAQLCNRA
eukprot:355383-Chlamydomonas_euryale.AAC.6